MTLKEAIRESNIPIIHILFLLFCLIVIGLCLWSLQIIDEYDKSYDNPNRPPGCNTSKVSDCFRPVQNDGCGLPFAHIMFSDCMAKSVAKEMKE